MFLKTLCFATLLSFICLTDCNKTASLIVAWTKRITQVDLDGSTEKDLLTSTHHSVALDVHVHLNNVFWSDGIIRKIYVASLDDVPGTRKVIVDHTGTVDGLAIDWIHDILYWTDTGTNTIELMELGSKIRAVIVSKDLTEPRGIALHPIKRIMFWTDWGLSPKIERASLDGSERTVIIKTNIEWPNGITLDFDKNRLYWIDGRKEKIESCDYDGLDRQIIRAVTLGFGISAFGSHLYYSDWASRTIRRTEKVKENDGFEVLQSAKNYFGERPMALQVLDQGRQPSSNEGVDRCKLYNPCPQLCINNYNNYSCFCRPGFIFDAENHICKENGFLLTAWRNGIIQLDMKDKIIPTTIHEESISIVGLDFLHSKGQIFWSNVERNTISRGELANMLNAEVFESDVGTVDGLAVDWVCNNLYWTDTKRDTIEVKSLETGSRKILYSDDLEEPRAIVIYPPKSLMFFTDWGATPKIESAALDGSRRHTIVMSGLGWPNGLAIDWDADRLYWIDGRSSNIESSELDGSDKTVFVTVSTLHQGFGIAINPYYIYYSEWKTSAIYRIERKPSRYRQQIASASQNPMSLRIYNASSQPKFENPCAQTSCSHICLPTEKGGSICACPKNYTLSSNGKTCINENENEIDEVEIHDVKIASVKSTSATITWKSSSQRMHPYFITFVCVEMKSCRSSCEDNSNNEYITFDKNITCNELKPGAVYNVSIFNHGRLLYNDTIETIYENRKSVAIPENYIDELTSTSVRIHWLPVNDCLAVTYTYDLIKFKPGDDSIIQRKITSKTSAYFNNLEPGTNYALRVVTFIDGLYAPDEFIVEFPFTTSEAQNIQELIVYKHTRKEVGLRWTVAKGIQEIVQKYKISYKKENSDWQYLEITQNNCTAWPDKYCYVLQNLTSNKNYTISIAPILPTDVNELAVNISAKTKEAAPDKPSFLSISATNLASIEIKWGIPQALNGQLRSFLITIEEVDKYLEDQCCETYPVMEVAAKSEIPYYETGIAGLHSASTYEISVSAKTVYFGPPEMLTVHTKPPSMNVSHHPKVMGPQINWMPQISLGIWPGEEFKPLITGYMLLAICIDSNRTDTGITDKQLNIAIVESFGPNFFLVAQYFEDGETIDLTMKRDVECKWGEASTSAFMHESSYRLAAVQVAQYKDSYRIDSVLSQEFKYTH